MLTEAGGGYEAAVVVLDGRASAPDDPLAEAYEVARGADGSQETELVAEGSTVAATGVISRDGQGFVDASDLPSLGLDQTYQLWGVLSSTGDVVSIGILGNDPGLEAFTVVDSVDALAITIEEAPGVVADGNPDGADAAVDQYRERFEDGVLGPEADLLVVEAASARKDHPQTIALGRAFLARHPKSPHRARVESLIARAEGRAP